jgi:hypothetical protein
MGLELGAFLFLLILSLVVRCSCFSPCATGCVSCYNAPLSCPGRFPSICGRFSWFCFSPHSRTQ